MENQRQMSSDRISALPQETIEKILTHMPIRDALRTSILSKKWRYCWTRMPKLVFDENLIKKSQNGKESYKYKLVSAIFHVLLQHRAPILEFSLIVNADIYSEIDLIIPHLSRSNNIKKFIFNNWETNSYVLPCSFFNLQGLEHLHLENCSFELPLMNKGFSMLKTLSFDNIYISEEMLQGFLTNCPLLEEFTWLTADPIEFTECAFVELVKCLPSVLFLTISEFHIEHTNADGMPQELPNSLVNLRTLDLGVHFFRLSYILHMVSSSPNLEKIKVHICGRCDEQDSMQTSNILLDMQSYMGLNLNHLKEVEITRFENHALEMEFIKIIMANSPVLKKAQIVLDYNVSVHEEVKMLRDLLHVPFPRASPSAKFIIERPKDYRGKEMYPLCCKSNFVD